MLYTAVQKQIEQRSLRTARKTALFRALRSAMLVAGLIAGAVSQSSAQTDGIMVLQNITTPRGGVWLEQVSGSWALRLSRKLSPVAGTFQKTS